MRDMKFDAAYCSDLGRAVETLEIILESIGATLHPIKAVRLREKSWGFLEGELGNDHVEERAKCLTIFDHAPEGGESFAQTKERVVQFYEEEIRPLLVQGKNVLLVCHSGSAAMLILHLENIAWEDWAALCGLPTAGSATYLVSSDQTARIA